MPTDSRGRLDAEPFTYQITKAGAIRIAHEGKAVTVLTGKPAARLITIVASAEPREIQLALAKATGNFKRGGRPPITR